MATPDLSLLSDEQFRMTSLQVYNWGTFTGLHNIPISEQGFLIVGRSGTGKSTLLDGISALLVPPRLLDFNAAAREADRSGRDRNLVSYIRGAWAEQKDGESGEIATRYLRSGTTWSALALTYQNRQGRYVVLAQVFYLRGTTNSNADVKRHYLVLERSFDLRELEDFGKSNLDVRKLKHSFTEAFVRDDFRPYCERFCRLLGIESEMALRLLHKTQSAKNLGDLNFLMRDYMLDKPETFAVADRLVYEFGELSAAHEAVVTAREQIQTLVPARAQYQQRNSLILQRNALEELRSGVDGYRETRRVELLEQHGAFLNVQANAAEGEVSRCQSILDNHKATLQNLQRQHLQEGGDQIEQWEKEKSLYEEQRTDRLRKRDQAEAACRKLDWHLPDSPQAFAELLGRARQEVENRDARNKEIREKRLLLAGKHNETENQFLQLRREIESLRRQPSNIPADFLEMRREIAAAISVSESALPFVGELLEVKPDEAGWQGAIERVLRGFALSVLVDEQHYPALTHYSNKTHLGRRLVYYRTGHPETWQSKPVGVKSLVLKLNVKQGRYADWLHAELRQRFDYACVDSMQSFRSAERAITCEGQIKHNKTRHEKDDRKAVDDRTNWLLGFDNREKLALFETQAFKLGEALAHFKKEMDVLDDQDQSLASRAMHCQTLVNLQWKEIDVVPLLDRIAAIEQQLSEIRSANTNLQQISERIKKQEQQVKRADTGLREAMVARDTVAKQIKDNTRKLESILQDASRVPLTPAQQKGLGERFALLSDEIRLDNLDHASNTVERALNAEVENINHSINSCEKETETCFADFKRRWPVDAGDMDTSLASAPDFFSKLERLETDGLPAHEQRFFELLQNQSHQNLAALSTYLNDARKTILERMALVNDSLGKVPFNLSNNQRTYLHIDVSDRQLVEVKEFRQEIQKVLNYALSEDRQYAENRFLILQKLVQRLASQDPEQKRWRESVLDVRQHVEFIGRETDEGGVEVEVYRSGAGKSGGQRQKLATTCLAAALRYQLGGNEHGVPIYAPVVLDEAFDKADNDFTRLAMNIFTNFGFQMIVATPMRAVMTLEPFIGGACFVDISDRRVSGILLIEYDNEQQKLKFPKHVREGGIDEAP